MHRKLAVLLPALAVWFALTLAAILTLNSMQGVNEADAAAGVTYLSIMQDNLDVLKQALA